LVHWTKSSAKLRPGVRLCNQIELTTK
jgi:hypothetical protein